MRDNSANSGVHKSTDPNTFPSLSCPSQNHHLKSTHKSDVSIGEGGAVHRE